MDILVSAMLAAALIVATITDIKSQRIYNWLTFPLILSGLATHTIFGGLEGLKFSGAGLGIGFVVMAVPYFLGVMGAGDVKLMTGIGAWLGASTTFTAFLFTCIAGGVYAIGVLVFRPELLKAVFRNIVNTFTVFVATRKFNFAPTGSEASMPRLCYGVAISVGTITAMAVHAWQAGSVIGSY